MIVARRRPFRATAFVPDPTAPNGRRREVAGRAAACSRAGLDAFVARHEAAGHEVDLVEILDLLDEIAELDRLRDRSRSGTIEP